MLYPAKGTIEQGAAPDLVVVDYERVQTLADEIIYSEAGYNPYAGQTVAGYLEATVLRGRLVARDDIVIPDTDARQRQ